MSQEDNTADGESKVCEIRNPGDGEVVDPMGAYRDAAPELLGELARLLSQYTWREEGCVPRGLLNILNLNPNPNLPSAQEDLTPGGVLFSPAADKKETPNEVIIVNTNNKGTTKKKKAPSKLSFEKKVKARPDLPRRSTSPKPHKDRGRQDIISQSSNFFDQIEPHIEYIYVSHKSLNMLRQHDKQIEGEKPQMTWR